MIRPEQIELAKVTMPEFGLPSEMPVVTRAEYSHRLELLRERMRKLELTHFIVYGDREHSANICYLSGYDPRFEEALFIVTPDGKPKLVVGNEGMGYQQDSPAEFEPVLFQSFSLQDQPRSDSPTLAQIFSDCGIGKGSRVGCAGWKYFTKQETSAPDNWLEIPSFIADTLRELTGQGGRVINAGRVMISAEDGLRTMNSAEQLAAFEFAATYCSQSIRNVVENIKPGMTELQGMELMKLNGLPMSCHPMLTAGPRAFMGLPSPSSRVIQRGEPFTTALGYWGFLSCRNGWVAEGEADLPEESRAYVEDLAKPYFALIVNYYNSLRIGANCGEIYNKVQEYLCGKKFKLALNPGHYVHIDEWVASPFYEGSRAVLKPGMALQVDLIPVPADKALFGANIEDGVALADEKLRDELAGRYPDMWERVQARREFMLEQLGIPLPDEVLPFSNLAARMCPYILDHGTAFRVKISM